jgi:acetoacetyl-CoA reductase
MARVALVTGGTRGIGEAISKALKAEGYEVAATYAGNDEKAAKFTEETGIKTYKWNVADYQSSKEGIARVEADLGPIDVVVANAGITRDAPFHKMTPEQWQEVVDTNLTGVFNTVHPVWPGMRERGFGRVIVISSINGQKGQFGQTNYAATKAGDLGIVKSLAQEGAAKGITANAICPGFLDTEMTDQTVANIAQKTGMAHADARQRLERNNPQGRLIDPGEVAAAALWLCGPGSEGVNGQAIAISGGET